MDWLAMQWSDALRILVSTVGVYAAVILFIRLNGLRSLSKMSSFDFAVTVAIGSAVASTVLSASVSLAEGVVGLAALILCQRLLSRARASAGASALVDNTPVVLMVGTRMLDDALERTRVTREDVLGKLREANVIDLAEVHAVVLEATGDISVLHGSDGKRLDPRLLEGVSGAEEVLGTSS